MEIIEIKSERKKIMEINVKELPEVIVKRQNDSVYIDNVEYELVIDFKEAFDKDAFEKRYTKLLDKYHYIVGDWGHDQLRLKGFYEFNAKVKFEDSIKFLEEYLIEYCAFGCRYFVLKMVHDPIVEVEYVETFKKEVKIKDHKQRINKKFKKNNKRPRIEFKQEHKKNKHSRETVVRTENKRKHPFTIK